MEKNHPVNELMASTIQKIRETVDANTVVGEPIVVDNVTIIPVSKISFGFGTGGTEIPAKSDKGNPFGGGGGAGVKVIPVCFLVVSGGSVKVHGCPRREQRGPYCGKNSRDYEHGHRLQGQKEGQVRGYPVRNPPY